MEDGKFVSIVVQKGGANGDVHKVDGISGGTITCDGVTDMIEERLSKYLPYFKSISTSMQVQKSILQEGLPVYILFWWRWLWKG